MNNYQHGKGTYIWSNGDRYDGEFKFNKMDGFGIFTYQNGKVIEGFWKEDNLVKKR